MCSSLAFDWLIQVNEPLGTEGRPITTSQVSASLPLALSLGVVASPLALYSDFCVTLFCMFPKFFKHQPFFLPRNPSCLGALANSSNLLFVKSPANSLYSLFFAPRAVKHKAQSLNTQRHWQKQNNKPVVKATLIPPASIRIPSQKKNKESTNNSQHTQPKVFLPVGRQASPRKRNCLNLSYLYKVRHGTM